MLAGLHRGSHKQRSRVLLAALLLASGAVCADAPPPLSQRLAAAQETIRINPQRGQLELAELAPVVLKAGAPDRAEFLSLSCIASYRLGNHERALALCEQALELARSSGNLHAIATLNFRINSSIAYAKNIFIYWRQLSGLSRVKLLKPILANWSRSSNTLDLAITAHQIDTTPI